MNRIYLKISLLPFLLGSYWIPYLLSIYTIVPIWLLWCTGLSIFLWVWIIFFELKNRMKQ